MCGGIQVLIHCGSTEAMRNFSQRKQIMDVFCIKKFGKEMDYEKLFNII